MSIRVIRGHSFPSSNGSPNEPTGQTEHRECEDYRSRWRAGRDEWNDDEAKSNRSKDGDPKPPAQPLEEQFDNAFDECFKHGRWKECQSEPPNVSS